MREFKEYNIDIFGLSNATHEFEFEFKDEFFCKFENSLIEKGSGSCKVALTKSSSMITIDLNITGKVELICDRSLEPFDFNIDTSHEVVFKYGGEEKELSEDVHVILKDTQRINISDFLYQFISLEIPMKKLHPKFQDEDESDEIIYSSNVEEETSDTEAIDPRWEALKKLK